MQALDEGSYKVVPGRSYQSPKEVWGFVSEPGRKGQRPEAIAKAFLRANKQMLGLEDQLKGLFDSEHPPRVVHSLAAEHVIFQQRHKGLRVHRAYVTVHVGRDRSVYLVKNRALPAEKLPTKIGARINRAQAIRKAYGWLEYPASAGTVQDTERMWYFEDGWLRPAYRVRVHIEDPREEWIVYVDLRNRDVLSYYDILANATARAQVFDPNPVAALGDHRLLLDGKRVKRKHPPEAYTAVTLRDLKPTGFLDGKRVTTAPTEDRTPIEDGEFVFESGQKGFKEAMCYYHLDRAIRYLELLGYSGKRAIFKQPLPANVRGTKEDSSHYSPGKKEMMFGTGKVDDAEDGETILHEFGHALQDMICPDFGQSHQAAAMGEGFGDYLAASFFAEQKPPAYRPCVMIWDGIKFPGDPPCVRRVDSKHSYESFHHAEEHEHANGQIWSATLWDIRKRVGRRAADKLIIEGHFQLDGFTTFARAGRAILDADRLLYHGRFRGRLLPVFHSRGIGPVE